MVIWVIHRERPDVNGGDRFAASREVQCDIVFLQNRYREEGVADTAPDMEVPVLKRARFRVGEKRRRLDERISGTF